MATTESNASEMLDWATIIAQLDDHASTAALRERAKQGFEMWFVNEGGPICGWNADEVSMDFRAHKLAFSHAMLPPFIETCFALHSSDGRQIGTYRLITDIGGATTDDYLNFDETNNVR
jgi:hypothetical protein